MIVSNVILFLSIVNFLLMFFVFLNTKKKKENIPFLAFSLVTTLWLFDNFLLRIFPFNIYGPLAYGFGALEAFVSLVWVSNLVEEKLPKPIFYFLIPFSIVVFFVSSFTNLVVLPFGIVENFGYIASKGILFTEYAIYISILVAISIFRLGKKSIKEKDICKKKSVFSIFIGALFFGTVVIITSLIIPILFNNFKLSNLDHLAYFPFLIIIFYSIFKYELFGIKIFLTQFLVAIFLSLLLLRFLLSTLASDYYLNGILLIISIFISYLIIKNVNREIELNKRLLEETQKNLEFEQRLKETYAQIAGREIKEKYFKE